MYTEDYYERGIETGQSCYTNYRWLPELTIPFCARICEVLGLGYEDTILDFGCAKGYMVKGFRLLRRQAWGVDVSEYAIKSAPDCVQPFIRCIPAVNFETMLAHYDWIIAKDVLEHVFYEDLPGVLNSLHTCCDRLFVIVPLGDGAKYNIPAYELDQTHVIRESLAWWESAFSREGFKIEESSYRIEFMKENWSSYENGNGFFRLRS